MRIVLDSNILVRAVISPSGPAGAVFDLIQPPHLLLTSSAVLEDFADGLRYPRLRAFHGLTDDQIDRVVQAVNADAEIVQLPSPADIPVVCTDRDDDFIVSTAVLGRADVLCTRDRHLRADAVVRYCQSLNVTILTDIELLPRLRAGVT